jgi:hypothetical protein
MSRPGRPYGSTPPDIEPQTFGRQALQTGMPGPNYPFAPSKWFVPTRYLLLAGARFPLFVAQTPCQKVSLFNEGPGDLLFGSSGLSLSAPSGGTTSQPSTTNAFYLPANLGYVIEIEDASLIYVGSVAGTILSMNLNGLPFMKTAAMRT